MPHPLDSFFAPQSIALIGASRDHEKIPGRLLAMCGLDAAGIEQQIQRRFGATPALLRTAVGQ